jgi:general secretion pathway protein G
MTNGDRPRTGIRELVLNSSFRATRGFTIVEILVVMAVILVLAGLVLATSSYVHNKGARSRAEAEITAMSAALENYKADNGAYPVDASVDARTKLDPGQYATASLNLYEALSGDADNDANRSAEVQSYFSFMPNQLYPSLLNSSGHARKVDYIKDPFGYSYGYSTAGQAGGATGYNPSFDLWSTAGSTTSSAGWIKNW